MGAHEPVGERTGGEGLVDALDALNAEQTLGRYELLSPIGRGGMAIVWAARLRATRGFSKIVALKTMLPALSADPRFEKMFLAEAEISSRIKHPNVCDVIDVDESDGLLYLVMEWIDGEPLSALLAAREVVDEAIAARIVAQAAHGLRAAHELADDDERPLGVVHRDVSPQNILVTHDGVVKVVDFGVAKAAQRSDNVTATGFIKGKVAYLAPEQIQKADVDARADVFALGVVLFEMVCGAHPFREETELSTMLAITSGAEAEVPANVSAAMRVVIAKALAKDPEARYPSMRELAEDLDAIASPSTDRIAEYIREALGQRRAERAERLREATLAADARALRKAAETEAASTDEASAGSHVAPSRPEPSRGRFTVVLAALAGIVVTVTVMRGFGTASAPARAPDAPAAVVTPALTSAPSAASSVGEPAPAPSTATTSAPVAPSTAPSVRVHASASRPALAAPTASTASAAASGPPPTRFREPGF